MLNLWRDDGYGRDRVELWVVGAPVSDTQLQEFTNGSEASCFFDKVDDGIELLEAYAAQKDYVFIIDAQGMVRESVDLASNWLQDTENSTRLDNKVRNLLDN